MDVFEFRQTLVDDYERFTRSFTRARAVVLTMSVSTAPARTARIVGRTPST